MSSKIVDGVRTMKVCEGLLEADWFGPDKEQIVYRFPDVGLSKIGVITAYRLDRGDNRTRTIHYSGFRYSVSRSAIVKQLKILEGCGFIEKAETMRGRNAYWRLLKSIGVFGEKGGLADDRKQQSINEGYKYHGNRATAICPDGHFGVFPLRECKHCGQQQFKLQILSASLRLPVKIYGYLVKPVGYAAFLFEDGTEYNEDEHSANRNYVLPGVLNQELVFARLFSWGIVTI